MRTTVASFVPRGGTFVYSMDSSELDGKNAPLLELLNHSPKPNSDFN